MNLPEIPGYQIQEQIGQGSMGVVYRARHLALDRVVALKVLNPQFSQDESFLKSFSQEAKTVARLQHPNIVTVHDFGCHEGLYYLTMQFVHGRTVKELLAIRRPNPLECGQIIRQIADALDYAHREEVIHRDVKPGNIMLCPDGKAMIMDFGVASGYYAGSTGDVWVMAGSPAYMSPEQCKGHKASPRSDQYALGITLYEMVTGRLPFEAKDTSAVRKQQISDSPPPLRLGRTDITPRMEAAVLRALAKIPEMRFVTVLDFANEFEAACQERPATDVLVGNAPGPDAPSPIPGAAPVSLIGGEKFASPQRSTMSSVYVSATRGVADSRRRRSFVLVMLLLLLCGGAGGAAYYVYFRPPAVTAPAKPKKTKKPVKKGGSRRSTYRSSRPGQVSPVTLHPDAPAKDGEAANKEEPTTDSEEPTTDAEKPADPDNPPADEEKDTEKKGEGEGKGEGDE
jgi:serine/threonine-protein kinase